jgi:hypothetical protein
VNQALLGLVQRRFRDLFVTVGVPQHLSQALHALPQL